MTTAATVIKESVQYVRADVNGGASRPTSPPKTTTVKISMKPRVPSVPKNPDPPVVKVEACEAGARQAHTCPVEHCRGIYYHPTHMETIATSRSPSPTKTIPNFARQYSVEGDSIFGYKVKDPLGTVAGADKSASSSSEDEKPKTTTSKTDDATKRAPSKRTITDRWPWIQKGACANIGKPPSKPAPDPPVKAEVRKRLLSMYVSPFDDNASPPSTPPPVRPVSHRQATAAATAAANATAARPTAYATLPTTTSIKAKSTTATTAVPTSFDARFAQIQAFLLLALKTLLCLYIIVAAWFVLDAVREALCVVYVPLRIVLGFIWAVVSVFGKALGGVARGVGGKVRVLGR
jgi:hypothetical protein